MRYFDVRAAHKMAAPMYQNRNYMLESTGHEYE